MITHHLFWKWFFFFGKWFSFSFPKKSTFSEKCTFNSCSPICCVKRNPCLDALNTKSLATSCVHIVNVLASYLSKVPPCSPYIELHCK